MRIVASAQHILATAVSGWLPNSAAVRAAQALAPSRRRVVATAPRTWPGEGDPEGCKVDANSAPARTASNVPGISHSASDVMPSAASEGNGPRVSGIAHIGAGV
jgi:hypothetical protein